MRDNHFIVLLFFSIIGIVLSTIYSGIIISQNNSLKEMNEKK